MNYLNAGDVVPERVINPSDRTQRLVINWIYALPFGHGQHSVKSTPFLSTLVGGWQVQGVFTRQSGPPLVSAMRCCSPERLSPTSHCPPASVLSHIGSILRHL
jgi:hypothetical protein